MNPNPAPHASAASGLWRRRVYDSIIGLLQQGITPDKIAVSLAFGIGAGVFPVLGVSTLACTVAALRFGLNLPAIQLVNYLVSPLQLLLIVPFVRLGEWLLRAPPQPVSVASGMKLLQVGVWQAVVVLREAIAHAALGWALVGPVFIYGLYRVFRPLLARAAQQLN